MEEKEMRVGWGKGDAWEKTISSVLRRVITVN